MVPLAAYQPPDPLLTTETHSSTYQNANAHAPQHNGHNIIHNYGGILYASAEQSKTTGDDSNLLSRVFIPRSLPDARQQWQALAGLRNPTSPSTAMRPGTSSHRVSNEPGFFGRSFEAIIGSYLISAVLFVFVCTAIMLIFKSKQSSLDQTPNVKHGFFDSWIDYSSPVLWQRRVTLSEDQAKLISGLAILLLALSIPSAYILLIRIGLRVCAAVCSLFWKEKLAQRSARSADQPIVDLQESDNTEETPLLSKQSLHSFWSAVGCIWCSTKSPQASIVGFMRLSKFQDAAHNSQEAWRSYATSSARIILATVFSLLAIGLFLGLAVLTILSADIVIDSTVLSDHPDCGFWVRVSEIRTPSPTGYDYLQEVEASGYAKSCHGDDTTNDGCDHFMTKMIPYNKEPNSQCPFEDTFCLDGKFSAYTLDTGHISSKALGINVEIGYSFRRKTTCSPVQRRATLTEGGKTYAYHYGSSTEFGNYSWEADAKPVWEFAGYNVVTLFHQRDTSKHVLQNWNPIPEFKSSNHDSVTLLLIQSQKNYHTTEMRDPVFPAIHKISQPHGNPPLYFNNDPVATALACVDSTDYCDASGKICFPNKLSPEPDLPGRESIGYYMLLIALLESNVWNSIQLLGGRALAAQDKLERKVSLPLAEEQWKVEAENLFAASLARPQIALRDYIRGLAAADPEYSNRTLANMQDMCQTYKFPGRGWRNVTVWGMVLIVFIVVSINILTIEVDIPPEGSLAEESGLRQVEEQDHEGVTARQRIIFAEWVLDSCFASSDTEAADRGARRDPPERDLEAGEDPAGSQRGPLPALGIPIPPDDSVNVPSVRGRSPSEGRSDMGMAAAETIEEAGGSDQSQVPAATKGKGREMEAGPSQEQS